MFFDMTLRAITSFLSGYIDRYRIRLALVLANLLFGVSVLWLSLSGYFPLGMVDFLFFSFLLLLVALYRPIWIFLLLVGMLPYESINVAPVEFGFALRPYQWIMAVLWVALGSRLLLGRPALPMFRWKWEDTLPIFFLIGTGLSSIGSGHSLRGSLLPVLLLASFVGLYFTVRLFVRTREEALHLLPFILSSFGIVACWSIVQNILFASGRASVEVMAGRPNGTFPEADWLGMYLLPIVAISLAWIYRRTVPGGQAYLKRLMPFVFLFSATIVLILSVSRSAWLGMLGIGICFAIAVLLTFRRRNETREGTRLLAKTLLAVILAFLVIPIFHLSRFGIFDRAASAGGLQKITIACDQDSVLPVGLEKIESLDQLADWHCRHIMLEDIGSEQSAGRFITTVYRDDPNVSIRRGIYERAYAIGMEHPIFGIGWGGIGARLGLDERGAALNASNIFLEFWLGSGIIGLVAFSLLWFWQGFQSWREVFPGDMEAVPFVLFFWLAWIGITLFNLFNSGILLGFFFFFLGTGGALLRGEHNH